VELQLVDDLDALLLLLPLGLLGRYKATERLERLEDDDAILSLWICGLGGWGSDWFACMPPFLN